MVAIEVDRVSKRFRLRTVEAATTLKTIAMDWVLGRRREHREPVFQALRDITFSVQAGQTWGIIGRNGSGKSTLLKLIARIFRPDSGRIRVHGRVAGLLELGAGFHPEFSGRENILINGMVLGLSKREIRRRFDDIVTFAELDGFIDEPVRTYSSGMYMRLGFAVAVHTDPDILLIDELLAVGDESFQRKCAKKIREFQRKGKAIVLVSHDLGAVEQWCDEALWLDEGAIRAQGRPKEVVGRYLQTIPGADTTLAPADHPLEPNGRVPEVLTPSADQRTQGTPEPPLELPQNHTLANVSEQGRRWGSRMVEITSVRLLDRHDREQDAFQSGEGMTVELGYQVHQGVEEAVFGIAILREDGLWCYGTNTDIEKVLLPPLGKEGVVEVILEDLNLIEGSYYLDVAVHRGDGTLYDYHTRLYPFSVSSEVKDVGVFRLPHRWTIKSKEPEVRNEK